VIGLQTASASARSSRAAVGVLTVEAAALTLWLAATPIGLLRVELSRYQFWSLECCVFLGLAIAAAVIYELAQTLERRDLAAALMLGALTAVLAATLPPRMARIFYDEQIYQNVARNLADSRRAQLCNDGIVENGQLHCARAEYNKQPYAFPHLLSLAYRAFGVRDATPYVVNIAAAALSSALLYLLTLALFEDRVAALFAALLYALMPEELVWAASGASEPTAALACIGALAAAACFIRARSDAALAGTAIAVAYAIQFRPESILIVPVVALLLWQRAREELLRPRMLWAAALFIPLAAMQMGHFAAVRNEGWGTTADRMSMAYAAANIRVNGWFFLADRRFPFGYALLAVAGLAAPKLRPGRATLATYFSVFFGVVLLFYAGSYDYGADVRYSLSTYPALVVLAGLGSAWLSGAAGRFQPAVAAALALAAAAQFAFVSLPVVRSRDDSAWAARADVDFAHGFTLRLPQGAYVLSHNPGMFHVWNVSAGQMSLATDRVFLDHLFESSPGGVYLHWNYWCNTDDPIHRALCTQVLSLTSPEIAGEERTRDQHYVFYRLKPAKIGRKGS